MTEDTKKPRKNGVWKNNGRIDVSVKLKEYKCFRDEFVGFDCIMPINVIIGRNNSGKSALLDMIQAICTGKRTSSQNKTGLPLFHPLKLPEDSKSTFEYMVNIEDCECNVRLEHTDHYSSFPSPRDQQYAESHVLDLLKNHHCRVVCQTTQNNQVSTGIYGKLPNDHYTTHYLLKISTKVTPFIPDNFHKVTFRRLCAERDIIPEPKSNSVETIGENGQGATKVVNAFCSNEDHNEYIVRKDLLEALNQIFEPDNHFNEIRVVSLPSQDNSDELWEIVLYESEKNRINLSQSGSGLKTVLLVLLNLLVVPKIPQKGYESFLSLDKFIFAFEELENNLHPSLLRRLFQFIEDFVIKTTATFS